MDIYDFQAYFDKRFKILHVFNYKHAIRMA